MQFRTMLFTASLTGGVNNQCNAKYGTYMAFGDTGGVNKQPVAYIDTIKIFVTFSLLRIFDDNLKLCM